jgi:hypothetical protein
MGFVGPGRLERALLELCELRQQPPRGVGPTVGITILGKKCKRDLVSLELHRIACVSTDPEKWPGVGKTRVQAVYATSLQPFGTPSAGGSPPWPG